MPPLVFSSRESTLTTILSPSGLRFIKNPLLIYVSTQAIGVLIVMRKILALCLAISNRANYVSLNFMIEAQYPK